MRPWTKASCPARKSGYNRLTVGVNIRSGASALFVLSLKTQAPRLVSVNFLTSQCVEASALKAPSSNYKGCKPLEKIRQQ